MKALLCGKKFTLITMGIFVCASGIVRAKTDSTVRVATPWTQNKEEIELGGFYVVTQAVSDKGTPWADKILDVRAEVGGVRVREIRIAPMNRNCAHNVTVKAVERVLTNTTVAKVAGKFKLCTYPDDDFAGVIQVAKRDYIESESIETSASHTVVAKCGTQQRLYELPYPETLKFEALKRADSRITDLWDLAEDVEDRTFGKEFSFGVATPEQNRERQELGAKIVPEIMSGKFDAGFPDSACAFADCRVHNAKSALQGYSGPINEGDPAFVEVENFGSLHLLKAQLPEYSRDAQRVHAQGEVRLKVFFDPATGQVTKVEPESGDDKLQDSAMKAAQTWQFQAGTRLKSPVEVTLRFEFHCPAK
ncbi:MAG TPA: TonB family protein [Candidatus Acidoferrales bacterium]|nr:TonB family protein [Candidatus Acidoferrales bacterium]